MFVTTNHSAPSPVSFQTVLARQSEADMTFGLQRITAVYRMLDRFVPTMIDYHPRIITVAGTNGKGSTCAFIESLLKANGQTTGLFTSPHLWRFNERIRINGNEVDDKALDHAMVAIKAAQREAAVVFSSSDDHASTLADVPLSYFELTALAAWIIFSTYRLSVVILEVGLGGRLDAVNLWDAHIAILTTIGLDHQNYLGNTRKAIAQEKIAIARPHCPLLCTETDLPDGFQKAVQHIGADYHQLGKDFGIEKRIYDCSWCLWWRPIKETLPLHRRQPILSHLQTIEHLPMLLLHGEKQYNNAAVAIRAVQMVLELDHKTLALSAIRTGLLQAVVSGRLEIWRDFHKGISLIFDVAHNPQAAQNLVQHLPPASCAHQRTFAILGMLEDKDEKGVVLPLCTEVDHWFLATLSGIRGQSAKKLAKKLTRDLSATHDLKLAKNRKRFDLSCYADPANAFNAAMTMAQQNDRIVILGSFQTVAHCYNTAKTWKGASNQSL